MGLFDTIKNEVKAAIGYQQSFTELLEAKDVSRAVSMMKDCSIQAANNLREYNVSTHKINERQDRAVYDKKTGLFSIRRETFSDGASDGRSPSLILFSSMR